MYYILILISLTLSATAFAEQDCSPKAIKSAREKFLTLYKKNEFQKGLEILKPFTECYPKTEEDNPLYCWLKSDYSLALLKTGKPYECRNFLGSEMDPRGTCHDMKSITTNFDLCTKEIEVLQGQFAATKCTMKLPPKTVASAKLPGPADKCLALIGTRFGAQYYLNELSDKDRDEAEEGGACPKLVLIENSKGRIIPKEIDQEEAEKPILGDTMSCCFLNVIGVQEKDGQTLIRLDSTLGLQQPCGGSGTARVEGSGNFVLKDQKLKLIQDTTWATH